MPKAPAIMIIVRRILKGAFRMRDKVEDYKGLGYCPRVNINQLDLYQEEEKPEIVKSRGKYYDKFHNKLHTPTARIIWLIACELTDHYPDMSATALCNRLNDIMANLEETNGGRF